jgi:SAM-dependent methyltransferase
MFRRLLLRAADWPPLWDAARRVIEADFRSHKKVIARELAEREGAVLDIPCGTGMFSPLFPDSAYTGTDLNARYVARARKNFPSKKFETGDALALPYADGAFQSVLVIGFLHHLPDDAVPRAVSELRRVLSPAGRLLLIEDCPTRSRWNLPGKVLQSLDTGDRIRGREWYEPLLRRQFRLLRSYALLAGVWDYVVYVLERGSPSP